MADPPQIHPPSPVAATPPDGKVSPGSILFGSIALALKRITPAQLNECLALQQALSRIGVYKPIGKILNEKGYLDRRGIREVLRAQGYKEQRLESRDYGRIAQSSGFVTPEQIAACLAEQKDAFRRGEGLKSLGRILVEKRWLDEQQHVAVMRTVRRLHQPKPVRPHPTTILYGVKECPVCFETIDFQAQSCSRCGSFLGELTAKPACPRCSSVEESGGEFCSKCGSNMLTGLFPSEKAGHTCQACGRVLARGQEQCYHCGHVRVPSAPARWATWIRAQGSELLASRRAMIALGVILFAAVAGAVFGKPMVALLRPLFVAREQLEWERSFEDFRLALIHGDRIRILHGLAPEFPVPAAGAEETERARRDAILRAILDLPAGVQEVDVLSLAAQQPRFFVIRATSYVQVQVRCSAHPGAQDKRTPPADFPPPGAVEDAAGRLTFPKRANWEWTRDGVRWLLKARG